MGYSSFSAHFFQYFNPTFASIISPNSTNKTVVSLVHILVACLQVRDICLFVKFLNPSIQMALEPGVGLGVRYNMPPGLSVPCCVSPFVYTHLSQVHGHVIQPSHSWSSSSSCCIQLSLQHLFWDCGVLHSFYMPKPSY